STQVWNKHHNVGSMASAAARRGRLTFGDGFARRRLRQKLKARQWKPTTNLHGNRSPLRSRVPTSPSLKRRNRKPTRRRLWIFTVSIRGSQTYKNNTVSRAISTWRKSNRVPPVRRMLFTPRSRCGRRRSARSKLSPATIPPESLMCDDPFLINQERCPLDCLRKSSNAGQISSAVNAVLLLRFIE